MQVDDSSGDVEGEMKDDVVPGSVKKVTRDYFLKSLSVPNEVVTLATYIVGRGKNNSQLTVYIHDIVSVTGPKNFSGVGDQYVIALGTRVIKPPSKNTKKINTRSFAAVVNVASFNPTMTPQQLYDILSIVDLKYIAQVCQRNPPLTAKANNLMIAAAQLMCTKMESEYIEAKLQNEPDSHYKTTLIHTNNIILTPEAFAQSNIIIIIIIIITIIIIIIFTHCLHV